MFQCVIFDFDMTLVDSSKAIRDAMNMLARQRGLPPVTREEVMAVIGLPIKDSWLKVWGKFEDEWLTEYREHFVQEEFAGMVPFPETFPVLDTLREKGVALGVASNRISPHSPIKAMGMTDYFRSALGMGDVERGKPAPDMILKSMDDLGFGKKETLYVGDTEGDMEAATAAGVRSMGLTTGNCTPEVLLAAGAWKVGGSLKELLPLWED